MRKIVLTIAAALVLVALPTRGAAQLRVGPFLAYHDDADFGVGGFLLFGAPSIHENLSIGGDFSIFFPDYWNYWEINGNALWSFPTESGNITPWVLGGLSIARYSLDVPGTGNDFIDSLLGDLTSDTKIGINLGGGATFGTASARPFAGGKMTLRDGVPFVIFGGVSFMVGGG